MTDNELTAMLNKRDDDLFRAYLLDGRTPVKCSLMDQIAAKQSLGCPAWRVGKNVIEGDEVSTVFLGSDHSWAGGPPQLFETMIFKPDGDSYVVGRCATYDEAEKMHANHVRDVRLSKGIVR